jgi:hypothetical protein
MQLGPRHMQLGGSMSFARVTLALFGALFLMGAGEGEDEKKKPPFADGPEAKKEAAKPAARNWSVVTKTHAFTLSFAPGIPDPNQTTEILILANAIPKTPHPTFGTRVPLKDARLTLEITNPAGQSVGTYLAHPIPLSAGKYGLHFTPTQDGIYGLSVKGRSADGQDLAAEMKMPVAVWPLPKELEGSGDPEGGNVRRPISSPGKK